MNPQSAIRNPKCNWGVAATAVLLVAAGVIGTAWLNSIMPGERYRPRPAVVKGDPINAPRTAWAQAALTTSDLEALTQADGTGFVNVSFDVLGSFYYQTPAQAGTAPLAVLAPAGRAETDNAKPKDQIPTPIKNLHGKKVAVQGFMVPFRVERGALKSFMLVKDRSLCCFGRTPRMNEWISVRMSGGRSTAWINDEAVTVFGAMEVGEEFENGALQSLYRVEAEEVVGGLGY